MKRQRLTPALPIEVVTPNVFIDSSPMVATTKGVKMGPGHCGRATKGKSGKPGWHSVITRPGRGECTYDTVDSDTLVLDELVR
jgi:hypothetical protein